MYEVESWHVYMPAKCPFPLERTRLRMASSPCMGLRGQVPLHKRNEIHMRCAGGCTQAGGDADAGGGPDTGTC